MNSKLTWILGFSSLAFAGAAGFLASENSKLKRALSEAREKNSIMAESLAESRAESESAEAGPVEGEQGAASTDAMTAANEPDAALSPEELREARAERRREERRERMREMLANLQDPETRLDFIERNMERVDRRYAEFFATLNVSSEEIEVLKTLMAERGIVGNEARMKMALVDTDEEREAIREEMRLQRGLLDGDIEALLGEEQAVALKRYNDTLPFRDDVNEFARSLSYTESPVSDRQSEALINTYARLSEEFKYSVETDDQGRLNGRDLTPGTAQTYFQEREVFDTMLLEQASAYLNDDQLASLAERQIAERERMQRRVQFMLERGGGGPRGGGFRGGRDF